MTANWFTGDRSGLRLPADTTALRDGGPALLTRALREFGVLGEDNAVTRIDRVQEVTGGSTGRKALLDLTYAAPRPGLCGALFVKFSRDFTDPQRDRGRTQMGSEVRFAALSVASGFPIAVPRAHFADYQGETGSAILISERITYGENGIEPHYPKCLDYEMPGPVEHYRSIITALARLAGAHRGGRLPTALTGQFPVDLQSATVGEAPVLTPERLERKLVRLAEFAEAHPGLLPAQVRAPGFLARLRREAPRVLRHRQAIWDHLAAAEEYIALSHWNANVDNAWFWTDEAGALRCGLMDWGCVSQMNVAMALWGAMCAAENALWERHFGELVTVFCTQAAAAGGPTLDPAALARQVLLYASLMGTTWLLDVPSRVRAAVPDAGTHTDRKDPRIRGDEGVRAPLQMLTNLLCLWESADLGAALAGLGD
ncbi:hypothetical protein [Mycolicibacterium palauense]|uniref:hypothetical protein n=1 Tax=Mycolicibacterium palauense TaxID=2034511 RepID=UPI000BFEE614|nr:hypothetical protein [Mycolicibacterium palauense]